MVYMVKLWLNYGYMDYILDKLWFIDVIDIYYQWEIFRIRTDGGTARYDSTI